MKKILVLALALLCLAFCLLACKGKEAEDASCSTPDTVPVNAIAQELAFIGLPGGDVTFTGAQLMELERVTAETESVNASGKVTPVTATGVLLETVLQDLGASQKDYASVRVTALDGYVVEIPREILQARDIVIAWEYNGEAMNLRTVVVDERAMYWVKNIASFEFKSDGDTIALPVDRIFILETMIADLPDVEYKYHDSADRAVPIAVLIDEYVPARPDFVAMRALDGLEKNERYETFAAQFIKYTGENAPLYIGPNLAVGMRLREVLCMQVGGDVIVSVETAMRQAGLSAGEGLPLAVLFEIAGMKSTDSCALDTADGQEWLFTVKGKDGIVIIEDGVIVVYIDNTKVENLLSITALSVKK